MCVRDGSDDLYTSTCPMCKVFRNSTRCPHKREVCRNRTNHSRHDVIYIANAEVMTFKGCGYCKWAVSVPPPCPSKAGGNNPGWPGCCRPPLPTEIDRIPPADWPAVNIIHRTPIPPDIKSILDSIRIPYTGIHRGGGSLRGMPSSSSAPERKSIARANSSPGSAVRGASGAVATPHKSHRGAGGSPQFRPSSLSGSSSSSRQHGSGASPISHATSLSRVPGSSDAPMKRVEGFRTTPPATLKKLADGEREHPYSSRTSVAAHPFEYTSNGSPKRRSPTSTGSAPLAVATNRIITAPKASSKTTESRAESKAQPKAESKSSESKLENMGLERSFKSMSISSGSSSDSGSMSSGGSSTDGTVTSDGAFTDYLSDESEAELQRQAEARALLLEQNRTEEAEFRQARQQLVGMGLRPPQAWREGISASQKR